MPSMHFYKNIVALFIVSLPLAPAQQSCYWPIGSGIKPSQGVWVNCYSSQDSVCCLNGDVCLSNGLCYGSPIGVVSPLCPSLYLRLPFASHLHARLRLIREKRHTEAHAPSKTGVTQQHVQLSGATTVKTLSTTDVSCPCMLVAANFFLLN